MTYGLVEGPIKATNWIHFYDFTGCYNEVGNLSVAL